jgi:hypothetical protein
MLEPTREIEAYGSKGFKNTAWRKTLRNRIVMLMWVEKNDSEILNTREIWR